MRRWTIRAVKFPVWRRPTLRRRAGWFLHPQLARDLSTATHTFAEAASKGDINRGEHREYAVFDRIARPEHSTDAWLALLDGALPPHLRDWSRSDDPPVLGAVEVAEILLAAQHPRDTQNTGLDLLYCLGFERERWSAAVWLIKKLVESFPARHTHSHDLSQVNATWTNVQSLDDFSRRPGNVLLGPNDLPSVHLPTQSLSELTDDRPAEEVRHENLGHEALGQVWRTLGIMTEACAGGDIKSEILEIIAYLHHKGVMPMAIYQSDLHQDKSVIWQPPLLSMLSSRILTSLSDAAWRAHEKLVIEEAKARGAEYAALRPEVPGSVYRVNIAGLRPELWMELILWSCLHGGWVSAGTEILCTLAKSKSWKVLSWDDFEKNMPSTGHISASEWAQWEHAFKTRPASSMDTPDHAIAKVDRTVSTEVVNAYIDALPDTLDIGFIRSGITFEDLTRTLHDLKGLLRRVYGIQHLRHGSRFGSWDALVTRIIESQSIVPERDSHQTQYLVALSTGFGMSLDQELIRDLPDYVRDGNLAMQGLLHRALYGQIVAGSLEGALRMFDQIQFRADRDKQASLKSFMAWGNSPGIMGSLLKGDIFTSNYSGIEYPAFGIKLPTTILGSFLELVTDAEQFNFGRWLLYNDDIDGPVITESMYNDEFVQPAVIRFAAETHDQTLLSKFRGHRLVTASFRAIFESRLVALQWDAAYLTLQHLADSEGPNWSIVNLASVARLAMVQLSRSMAGYSDSNQHFSKARTMLRDMCMGKYYGSSVPSESHRVKVQTILAVLSAVDDSWARFCLKLRTVIGHHPFLLRAMAFNRILEGVVIAYGSAAGRKLLQIFWPYAARSAYDASLKLGSNMSQRTQIPRVRPRILSSTKRQRIVVTVPKESGQRADLVMYGALTPNVNTILIILRQALEELKNDSGVAKGTHIIQSVPSANNKSEHLTIEADLESGDATPRSIVKWAVRRLAELPYVEESIIASVDRVLSDYDMEDVRMELPTILGVVEADILPEAEEEFRQRSMPNELDRDPSIAVPQSVDTR